MRGLLAVLPCLAVPVAGGAAGRGSRAPPSAWLANERPVATTRMREWPYEGLSEGFSRITVTDAEGRSASTAFELPAPG